MEKRRQRRWRYLDFVFYRSETATGEGHLANLSETGVFVRTDNAPRPGESVQIDFQGPSGAMVLDGHVKWAGQRDDGAPGFGVELHDPPAEFRELVESLEQVELTRGRRDPWAHRLAPRISLSIPVAVEFGAICDTGTLCEISVTGARLEGTRLDPPEGRQITITFALDGHREPFEVVARVVRQVEPQGYAVEFEAIDPRLKDALGDATQRIKAFPDSA